VPILFTVSQAFILSQSGVPPSRVSALSLARLGALRIARRAIADVIVPTAGGPREHPRCGSRLLEA
jgi:hypothetical protein